MFVGMPEKIAAEAPGGAGHLGGECLGLRFGAAGDSAG